MGGGARQSVNQAVKWLEARGYIRVAAPPSGRSSTPEQLHRLAGG
jgi:hypothetical protein